MCKYCEKKDTIQTTKEIGENYNYSCRNHSVRSKNKWVSVEYIKSILLSEELSDYGKITKLFAELEIYNKKNYCTRQCKDCKEAYQVKWEDNNPYKDFICSNCRSNTNV